MKTLKYQSAKDELAHTIEKMYSYKKCYMYIALITIGDFGVDLLTLDDFFLRWANRARKITPHDIPTEQ